MNAERKFQIVIAGEEHPGPDILAMLLGDLCSVHVAASGSAAIKLAREMMPDIVLLDVLMPDMSGFEILAELKRSVMTQYIPVIFTANRRNVKDEEKGFFMGAVDYITKPFNHSILRARVVTHLKITKHVKAIREHGMIDPLTGMPGRGAFDKKICVEWSRAIREKSPISLLIIGLDNLREYNDANGYPQGDILLHSIGSIVSEALEKETYMAARVGGDEFAIIIPSGDTNKASDIADTILEKVRNMPPLSEISFNGATISIAVSTKIPGCKDDMAAFVIDTDRALHKARSEGGDRVYPV